MTTGSPGAILALAAAAHRKAAAEADAAWAPYAAAHGLEHRRGEIGDVESIEPRMTGIVDGMRVVLTMTMVDGDWGTLAVAEPPDPLHMHLDVTRETWLDKIRKLFGAKGLGVGDERFDHTYTVHAVGDGGAQLLTAETRAELLALGVNTLAYHDGTETKAALVGFALTRLVTSEAEIARVLKLAAALAAVHPDSSRA